MTLRKLSLVDRKDLDSQTEEEFNKFAGAVDKTFNTSQLVRQLNDKSLPLIVTTIQKWLKAIQGNAHLLEQYKTNKVVFIIDECHRSQFGDMHRLVKQHFKMPNILVHWYARFQKIVVKMVEQLQIFSVDAYIRI